MAGCIYSHLMLAGSDCILCWSCAVHGWCTCSYTTNFYDLWFNNYFIFWISTYVCIGINTTDDNDKWLFFLQYVCSCVVGYLYRHRLIIPWTRIIGSSSTTLCTAPAHIYGCTYVNTCYICILFHCPRTSCQIIKYMCMCYLFPTD